MSIPTAQDEPGPLGAPPKGPGKTQPTSSVPPLAQVHSSPKGPWGALGGGDREGKCWWGFLSYLRNEKEMPC